MVGQELLEIQMKALLSLPVFRITDVGTQFGTPQIKRITLKERGGRGRRVKAHRGNKQQQQPPDPKFTSSAEGEKHEHKSQYTGTQVTDMQ